jgi:hypothetical protein
MIPPAREIKTISIEETTPDINPGVGVFSIMVN